MEAKLTLSVELLQTIAELSPEDFRERFDWKEIMSAGCLPPATREAEATSGHDAVEMVMIEQRLAPGMQHSGEADLRFELTLAESKNSL